MKKWQNPLCNHNSDILHIAMQHSGLHTTNLQPTVDLSLNLPLATMPLACTTETVQPPIAHASIFTQTSPHPHTLLLTDQHFDQLFLVTQTSAIHSAQMHVQALLQLNLFVAQLLIIRQVANRPFTDWEHQVVQTIVSQNIWPNSFLLVQHCMNCIMQF